MILNFYQSNLPLNFNFILSFRLQISSLNTTDRLLSVRNTNFWKKSWCYQYNPQFLFKWSYLNGCKLLQLLNEFLNWLCQVLVLFQDAEGPGQSWQPDARPEVFARVGGHHDQEVRQVSRDGRGRLHRGGHGEQESLGRDLATESFLGKVGLLVSTFCRWNLHLAENIGWGPAWQLHTLMICCKNKLTRSSTHKEVNKIIWFFKNAISFSCCQTSPVLFRRYSFFALFPEVHSTWDHI